jgi:hypothetical protein
MIGKLLGILISLIAAVCVATVISAVALIMFYSQSWKVNHARLVQALAILQGKSPESLVPPPPPKKANDSEQPAYDQVLNAADLKRLDLDKREMAIRANIQQFQEQLDKIAEVKKHVESVRDDLQATLDEMKIGVKAKGAEDVALLLQSLKPNQAKELIKMRLEKGETDVVVKLLSDMSDSKRAKIIAEFKEKTEMEQIGEVLNRIRQGQPTVDVLDDTGKKLKP